MTCDRGQSAFLGRMTAGSTHELRNMLAIIKESAGLIGDSLGKTSGTVPAPGSLQRAVDRVNRQVARGVELLDTLNHLAHCPDQTEAATDLNREAACAVGLGQRIARQYGITLQLDPAAGEVSVQLDSLQLQMVLFAAVEFLFERCAEGSTITVRVTGGEQPTIELAPSGEAAGEETPGRWQQLCSLAADLQILVKRGGQGRVRIIGTHW